jgi:hypothetical protein
LMRCLSALTGQRRIASFLSSFLGVRLKALNIRFQVGTIPRGEYKILPRASQG